MALLTVDQLSVHFGETKTPFKAVIVSVTKSMKAKY